jgi:methyl-accepting chemotaxis protein
MKRLPLLAALALLALPGCDDGPTEPQDFMVEGDVALGSLIALGDGHLQQIVNHFQMLATTDDVRSADWERIRGPLGAVDELNTRALIWFALPDGSYWSVQHGQEAANLSDRAYWPRLMAGETVLGDLVVSRATGKSVAIVAVPVRAAEDSIVGVLGSSVYLDSLSLRIKSEMRLQPDELFYSIDATPICALNSNPDLIFLYPLELGEPELEQAILEMLSSEEGVVNYSFRGERRTVLYRKSHVSGWWYAFGRVRD